MAVSAVASLLLAIAIPCARGPSLPAYSHNDYRNPHPLVDALAMGYRGVEVDLVRAGDELLVGHERRALQPGKTLTALYLDPLRELVRTCAFLVADSTPLLLTIELKEADPQAFRLLVARLAAYAELFRGAPPPVRVVLVGWWPRSDAEQASWPEHLGVQLAIGDRRDVPAPVPPRVALVSIDYGKVLRGKGRTTLAAADSLARALRVPLRVHHAPEDVRVYQWLLSGGVTLIGAIDLRRTRALLAPLSLRACPTC